ncbi:MAG: hypothetical protein ACE3L7_32895 [Candidatus Pristimantibacillus sp.]
MNRKPWEYIFLFVMCNVIALCAMSDSYALYILAGIMFTFIVGLITFIIGLDKKIKKRHHANT